VYFETNRLHSEIECTFVCPAEMHPTKRHQAPRRALARYRQNIDALTLEFVFFRSLVRRAPRVRKIWLWQHCLVAHDPSRNVQGERRRQTGNWTTDLDG